VANDLSLAITLCKRFEGFRSKPYLCPAGVWTIGYGTIKYPNGKRVTAHDEPITEKQAEEYLLYQLNNDYLPAVLRLCPGIDNNSRLNAIVDFAYNLGENNLKNSTLRKVINQGDWESAKIEIMKWVKGGGKTLPGLVNRRSAERSLL
jgi:lysozyme